MLGLFKHQLPEDFYQGACDVHCHLLPGVDDGFATAEKSLIALQKLEKRGIKKMVLTPHFMKEYPNNNRVAITEHFETFKAEAAEACNIELHLGAEYMLDACFMDHFKQGFLALDKEGTHVLCETSYLMYEHGITENLYDVMCEGFQPVIAHPERYEYASQSFYDRWKDRQYKFQLNLLSLAGAYGPVAMAKAHHLLKDSMYDFVGSDMHNLSNFERFLPQLRLTNKEIDQLFLLKENNEKLFG